MKHLLTPTAIVAITASALCQARMDVPLLLPTNWIAPSVVTGTECDLRKFVSADLYAEMSPSHQQMIVRLANDVRAGVIQPHGCWMGQAQPAVMALWNNLMKGPPQFNATTRWGSTATSGGGLAFGDPTIITYSFVPDGTNVPAAVGSPAAPSQMFGTFNTGFPSQQIWQDRISDAFERWGQLTGITYVLEPNDDGVSLGNGNPGVMGVRGDVRIAAKSIDGASGSNILAYNYFPDFGDMVLDSDNISFYANAGANYQRLFNVVAHEHGHGMGISHVCPVNQSKLMEPFISTAFTGPQFDDILASQRLYGDASEPNDTSTQATDLGTLANGTDTTTLVSIDGNTDQDWFQFTVTAAKTIDVVVMPSGSPYLDGDQLSNGSCEPGVNFDPRSLRNLGVEIIDSFGSQVLGAANSAPAGSNEVATAVAATAGTYFVRVFAGAIDQVQLYQLDVTISDGPAFGITIAGGPPATIPSDVPYAIDVQVVPASGNADPTSGVLFSSINGAAFTMSALFNISGNDFRGVLPAAQCLDMIDWYVGFTPIGGGPMLTNPSSAPSLTITTEVLTTVFEDNFQSNLGWTVTNEPTLTDGAWERGVPAGGGDRGDPASDADGSGACYLTDNVDGNSDVDGGATQLTSPVFDLSSYIEAHISFAYWYTNNFGGNPNTDTWSIEISDNGGASWASVLNTTASTTSWTNLTVDVSNFVSLTSQVQLRFTASDPGTGAVVEAGVDAFRVDVCNGAIMAIPGACTGVFSLTTIEASATPLAGTSITFDCTAVSNVTGPVFEGFVLGLNQAPFPLVSCGCTLHPTLDSIDIQLGNWSSSALATWSLPFVLPLGTAGVQFYVQGFAAELTAGTCTEAGLPLNTTDALRVTVQ